jgi:hypothetical protein
MNLHELAEARSLAYHREIAMRLVAEPAMIATARKRIGEWTTNRRCHADYLAQWRSILSRSIDEIAAAIIDESETGRSLRQSTPFAGMLDPRERWQIWRETRARLEGKP